MIVDPDFPNHWKTKSLANALGGNGPALQAVLLLWGHCQSRKAWQFQLTPLRLAGICGWEGRPQILWEAMIELPFIEPVSGELGWWQVHEWADRNSQLIHNWGAKSGGWDAKGYAASKDKSKDPSKGVSKGKPKDVSNDLALDPPIGLDRLDKSTSPLIPQGGKPESKTPTSSASETPPKEPVKPPTEPPQKKKKGAAAMPAEPQFSQDVSLEYREALTVWWNYKRERGEAYKPTGWAALIGRELQFPAAQVAESVRISTANNWAGLFTDKVPQAKPEKKEGGAAEPVAVPKPDGYARACDAIFGYVPGPWAGLSDDVQARVLEWLSAEKKEGGSAHD